MKDNTDKNRDIHFEEEMQNMFQELSGNDMERTLRMMRSLLRDQEDQSKSEHAK